MKYIAFVIVWALIATVCGVAFAEDKSSDYASFKIERKLCLPSTENQAPTCLIDRVVTK